MSDSTTPLGRSSRADLQNVKFPRRELPGKLLAIGVALLPERQSKISVNQTGVQPKFKVGDLVSSYWEDEEDPDAPDNATDFGEILGMRWVSSREPGLDPNTWVYFVRWTHSTCGLYSCYPCYDGEPTRECDLTLVKQS
jgi:hypothetical protein